MKQSPNLILICGRPASGKSTLAKALAREIHAVLIDKDCIDEPFSPDDRGPFYQKEIEPKAYHALLNLAALNLDCGRAVILDAPWTHQMLRQPDLVPRVWEVVNAANAKLIVFDIAVSQQTIRQRLAARGYKRDEDKLTEEGWKAFAQRMQFGVKNSLPNHTINGEESLETCLVKVLDILNSPQPL